jgi:collagen type I alpha
VGNLFSWWNPSGGDFASSANWIETISPTQSSGPPAGPPGAGDTADISILPGTISGVGSVASLTLLGIATSPGGPDAVTITGQLEAIDFLDLRDATIDGGSVTTDTFNALFGTLDLVNGGMVVGPSGDASSGQHITFQNPVTVTDGTVQAGDIQFFNDFTLEAGAIHGTDFTFSGNGKSALITGGTVSLQIGIVGVIAGDSDTVTMSGSAVWNTATNMVIGDQGAGTVDLGNGTQMNVGGSGPANEQGLVIGSATSGQGSLDIAGGTLNVTGALALGFYVFGSGNAGGGNLSVDAGGTAEVSGTVDAGYIPGGTGSITVSGTNAVLSATDLVAGGGGTGSVAVDSGGSVSASGDVTAGDTKGGTGVISVGTAGELSVGGSLVIGNAGSASLDVNGGSLSVTGQTLTAGNAAGGNGDISFENTSFSYASGNIVIGNAGTGSLSVNTKATINANDLDIGQALTGNGTAVFSGATGNFSNVNVGNAGIASLEVSNKGTVSASNLFAATAGVPQPASVSVDSGGVLQTALQVAIGQLGDAALDIESGGKVQATSVLAGEGTGVNASVTLNSATSSKSSLIYGTLFEIGVLGTADVAITGSAAATPDALYPGIVEIGVSAGSSGTLSISGASAKLTATTVEIGGGTTAGGAGLVSLDSSGVLSAGTTTIWNGGSLLLSGGSLSGTTETVLGIASGYGSVTGTIDNAGTITATGGVLSLGSLVSGTGTLALESGTLDLKKGAAASQVVQFGTGTDKLQLDALAATAGTLEGFGTGDTILITGTLADAGTWSGGVLTLTETASTAGTLAIAGAFSANSFKVSNNGTNTTIVLACFATGTGITTTTGRKPVEALATGERVPTLSGRLATIRWIGRRETDLARHARPWEVMPVRVRAGALGDGVPLRDLVLSPDHAMLVDGELIPVRHLVNGASIVQETRRRVTYWHIELDRHDAILAEGAPCESYLDTGNRRAFEGQDAIELHADFAQARAMAIWHESGCAPVLTDPADPRLRAAHLKRLGRAEAAGQNSVSNSDLLR